jgi:hypothetical protein
MNWSLPWLTHHEDRGDIFLLDVGIYTNYIALQPARPYSSHYL